VTAAAEDHAFAFRLQAADWEDYLLLVGAGPAGDSRAAGGWSCDGLLCYARHSLVGSPVALAVAETLVFSDDQQPLVESSIRLVAMRSDRAGDLLLVQGDIQGATVRILAPGVTDVTLNDGPVDWWTDGDYVVLNPGVLPDGGSDAGTDAGGDPGADAAPDGAGTDAGSDTGTDAGTTDAGGDAGDEEGGIEGGCSCDVLYRPGSSQDGSPGGASLPVTLLLFVFLALRKIGGRVLVEVPPHRSVHHPEGTREIRIP
jgi:hypothetical protein